MVNNLIILGAGGDGRTLLDILYDINQINKKWNVIGFLDDDPKKEGKIINGYPVLGKIIEYDDFQDTLFVTMIGNATMRKTRKKVNDSLNIDINKFATIIHPSSAVSRYADIGRGVIVFPNVFIQANIKIGNHVHIHSHSFIGHDTIISDYVTIASSSNIAGYVSIGEGCYIGMNSAIRERLKLGNWSVVGMGSVVTKDVPEHTIVVGNPARVLRKNGE